MRSVSLAALFVVSHSSEVDQERLNVVVARLSSQGGVLQLQPSERKRFLPPLVCQLG